MLKPPIHHQYTTHREVAREKHQQRHLLETMFVQVQRRRLAAAFASWRNHTTVLVDARQVAHQRAHARRTSLLRDALWGWRDVVEDTQQQRALLMRAVLRIATCRLRWAFSVWRQVTDEEKEDKWRAGVEQEEARRWEDGCVGKMQVCCLFVCVCGREGRGEIMFMV